MARNTTLILIFIICAFCLSQNGVYAFGAGNIPSFAYVEGKAFRHGDIEDVLAQLIKRGAGGGFALTSMLSKGTKFNGLDVKRVYFGNWLRDYSQAVDVACLKKMQLQTIITLCMVLGFMAHGYATHEFEVTPERLGVYLPTEHIDNPKGYAEGDDARKYHPKLRGPVDPRELEIDSRTGMKNYIANEQGHWDTSKALVRRTLERCIQMGRQNRVSGQKQDEYEAFRLLGQALHTLEDFSAHSNFCELTLISMGHEDVFAHVGDRVRIPAPNGKYVAPLVTGSFGSSDFVHSLLGEASDHLSEASVTDLNKEIAKARSKSMVQSRGGPGSNNSPADSLRGLLFALPAGAGSDMSRDLDSIERMGAAGGKRPEDMSPQELHSALWQVLTFRDSVAKKIEKTIEKIPGLESLVEKIRDSISVFVFTVLEPILKPVLQVATSGLQSASGEAIDNRDQYEVFNDPAASDPTHSFLSKDHFNLVLNEPAGQIAQRIVMYTVKLVTKAWDDNSMNIHQLTDDVLQCLFHPDFHNPQSPIQREMLQCMRDWLSKSPNKHSVIQRLRKDSVRNHQNVRIEGEGGTPAAQGTFVEGQAHQLQHTLLGYAGGLPAVGAVAGLAAQERGHANLYYNDGKPPGSGGSTYAPPAGPPPHHAPSPAQHHSGSIHAHAGYTPSYSNTPNAPPSFPGSAPSFPGAGRGDGLSFPGGSPYFPGEPPSGPPSFFDGAYPAPPGPPPSRDMYHAPPGPPPHMNKYQPPPGPHPHGDGYRGFPSSPGDRGGPPGSFGFPAADAYPSGSSGPPEFPSGNNSYPYRGSGWSS